MENLLGHCLRFLEQSGVEAYLVGGVARDQLLGRESRDVDLAVPRGALMLARQLADALGGAYYPLDVERETGRVVMPDRQVVDVAVLRGGSLETDLASRDFTINAMARHIGGDDALIDPYGGARDLRARTVRAVHEQAFASDPVRLLRAVRLAAELDFDIEPMTAQWMTRDAGLLAQVSGERVRDELAKLMVSRAASLQELVHYQLFSAALPRAAWDARRASWLERLDAFRTAPPTGEVSGRFDSYLRAYATGGRGEAARMVNLSNHARSRGETRARLRPYEGLGRWPVMALSVLYEGKVAIASDLRRLKFSRHEIEFASQLVRYRGAFEEIRPPVSPLAAHRFFRDTGGAGVGLISLALCEPLDLSEQARNRQTADALLEAYVEHGASVIAPTPLLNGAQIAEHFGVSGPQIARLLRALIEAQVQGMVQTAEEAERYLDAAMNAGH